MTNIPEEIKQNMIYALEQMSIACPRICFDRTPRATRYESDLLHPLFNRVIAFEEASSEYASTEINAIADRYRSRKAPFSWLTWSHEAAVDELALILEENGLRKAGNLFGMSLSLVDWTYNAPYISGFDIQPIRTKSEFAWFKEIVLPAFGLQGEAGDVFMQTNEAAGIGERAVYKHYVGLLNGLPAGAATAIQDGETIGIYNVATSEAFRRKGIGSAITAHAVLEGKAAGGQLAVLQSSKMGRSVYQSLGFHDDVTIGLYLG
ncbi:GNAT family N-acetyltransferase [Paenibacillus glycinis]|uniref:GNAT family N-acetyltransferase n=1 Tax=Paenibacillus glycinis TaxID=2697035 RepID=A0ABW9XWC6_9BACL|nr:GNAT family N-acetyltransferase [Paenibacillus glycinis]NBD27023.1 GNAT family N-acetyltransferase [Paenibacillus glycinis]